MKRSFYIAVLAIALPAFLFGGPRIDVPDGRSTVTTADSQNDNRNRRRGRGCDDSNRNGHNSNSSNSNSSNSGKSRSSISSSEARAAGLRAVPGTIVKEEFEQGNGRSIFELYIRTDSGETFEVYVDAETGDIVKTERRSRD